MLKKAFIISSLILICACTPAARDRALRGFNAYNNAMQNARSIPQPYIMPQAYQPIPVYGNSQCIGAQIMGQCHGSVMGAPIATCHGSMLNGQCIGVLLPQ